MHNSPYPAAYEHFLYEFHAVRDYFECHELLEAYWKEHPGDGFGDTWIGLIQLAVGSYHHRRGNQRGALKMFQQSLEHLAAASQADRLGIDGQELLARIARQAAAVERGESFTDMNIPLTDAALLERLQLAAAVSGKVWGAPSDSDEALLHRHTLRDRSDVIAARAAAAEAKKLRKSQ
ncbi:DUF309 domain-containing protein [Paenibacillus sp. R14(2021)]|uniref:DUF309 domain-containing protein n=1 Tax=Paenibacillus sp. R14(2021) TaxID=2859228 RepID=UPI001C6140D5|nr:DUF309 domain-containing protein [Paenibacillus sp. R14(2021)]